MLEEMTLSKGRSWLCSLSCSLRSSALIASSPRTAYWTFWRAGLRLSIVRARISRCEFEKERFKGVFIDGSNLRRRAIQKGNKT